MPISCYRAPMTHYVALLRAVNLGPHNQIAKEVLKGIGEACGFAAVRTYIASGNLLFHADASAQQVKGALEQRLASYAGKPIATIVRTAEEMAAVCGVNPFPDAPGNRVLVTFLDQPPPTDALQSARHVHGEMMALGAREIFVRFTEAGMGRSHLDIPAARLGTARNMNTVAKLAELAYA
jgi:uncharacterized protein (DUF1697 family)